MTAQPLPAMTAFELLRPSELAKAPNSERPWLWRGYLAPGKVTALISSPKSGKTTLLSHLLARLHDGGQLAGFAVTPGRAVVISEEAPGDWDARCRHLGMGPNIQFVCRPFCGARPSEEQWFKFVGDLGTLHGREPFDLLVIDTLATFLPGYAENCTPKLLDCLLPLQALANQGPAVWLLHHPAKHNHADGQTSRGAIALPGFVNIVMEMSCYRRARSRDRRRRIRGYSHCTETPRHLIIELTADGSDYIVRTDAAGTPLVQSWREVHYLLSNEYYKRSQQWILQHWPTEDDPPDRSTLSRWLKRATVQGVVCCSGTGLKSDPLVYWLPGREPLLCPADETNEEEMDAWRERIHADEERLREQQGAA